MTKRILCQNCDRPEKGCICRFITRIENNIHVVVLQHDSEVNQTKGTITLLSKSLTSCQVIIGEDFTNNITLLTMLNKYQALLLYPSDDAQVLSNTIENSPPADYLSSLMIRETVLATDSAKPYCLIILDGTWKKAYKMFKLSKCLQELPQICLPESLANKGQYQIRKVAKKNALSSLEACCYALTLLENNNKYRRLIDNFVEFNLFQLSFRPQDHLSKLKLK